MIEEFIADTEKLLGYMRRIERGQLVCIGPARRLSKKQGLGMDQLEEAIQAGMRKRISAYLESISEGEDTEVYATLIRELAREHDLDIVELEKKILQAMKDADFRRFARYINMIENENIHLISKARAIQRKYRIAGHRLDEAIRQGESAYLLRNIRQIRKGPRFHPLLPREEILLRRIARKYGHEEKIEEAIRKWRDLNCHTE